MLFSTWLGLIELAYWFDPNNTCVKSTPIIQFVVIIWNLLNNCYIYAVQMFIFFNLIKMSLLSYIVAIHKQLTKENVKDLLCKEPDIFKLKLDVEE